MRAEGHVQRGDWGGVMTRQQGEGSKIVDDIHSDVRSERFGLRRGEGHRAEEPKKINEAMSSHNRQL